MDGPLVFLTSTSDSVPSGRNARAVARASMVRQSQSIQSKSARGTFNVFLATRTSPEGKKALPESISLEQPQYVTTWEILAQQSAAGNVPRVLGPQSIAIGGLLDTATARIRHDLTSALKKQPSRVRDALRRRQWASAAFASGTLRLTPEVHCAIKYLEHKLQATDRSEQPCAIELQKYGVALVELQQSLRDPERRMQPSVLAASHILVMCEMLADATSENYLKFVNGIVTLSNLHACKGDYYARSHVHSRAGAILVEALLTRRYDAILDEPWSQTLISAGNQGHISPEDASSFAGSADLIFSGPSSTDMFTTSRMTKHDRAILAAKARTLHATIRKAVQSDLILSGANKYACSNAGVLSERVAVMLGLDDFIAQVAEGGEDPSELIHDDICSFYADAICAM